MMRESTIEAVLVRSVRRLGGEAIKLASVGYRGLPDRLVVLPGGRLIFVEVKAPGEKISAVQARVIANLRHLGASVVVVGSLESLEMWLAGLGEA